MSIVPYDKEQKRFKIFRSTGRILDREIHDNRIFMSLRLKDLELDRENKELKNNIDYLQDEIKKLNKEIELKNKAIEDLKDIINKYTDKFDRIKYLEEFRDMLMLICINDNHKITILQCGSRINNNQCKFFNKCKPRLDLLKKIGIKLTHLKN